MAKIFVSYRRDDSPGHSGRLYDHLIAHFGEEQVFRDIEDIELGVDFVAAIQEAVGSCDILVAVIGREWLSIRGKDGQRRLDNPKDFVRLEIATALARGIRVIPVLVADAAMPSEEELPPDLVTLARRNAIEVDDARFRTDIDRLFHSIQQVVPELQAMKARAPVQATFVAGSTAEPPRPPPPAKRSHKGLIVGLVAVFVFLFLLLLGGLAETPDPVVEPPAPVATEPSPAPDTGTGGSGTAGQEAPVPPRPEVKPTPPAPAKEEVVSTPPRPRRQSQPAARPAPTPLPREPVEQPRPREESFEEEIISPSPGAPGFEEEALPPGQDPSFDEEIIQ
ncbi:TIR domain-containing protein [Pyxidicoccus sp. 3LFB2]